MCIPSENESFPLAIADRAIGVCRVGLRLVVAVRYAKKEDEELALQAMGKMMMMEAEIIKYDPYSRPCE